jgi:hypothetical protein
MPKPEIPCNTYDYCVKAKGTIHIEDWVCVRCDYTKCHYNPKYEIRTV